MFKQLTLNVKNCHHRISAVDLFVLLELASMPQLYSWFVFFNKFHNNHKYCPKMCDLHGHWYLRLSCYCGELLTLRFSHQTLITVHNKLHTFQLSEPNYLMLIFYKWQPYMNKITIFSVYAYCPPYFNMSCELSCSSQRVVLHSVLSFILPDSLSLRNMSWPWCWCTIDHMWLCLVFKTIKLVFCFNIRSSLV